MSSFSADLSRNESKASTFRHESFKRFLDLPLELQYTVWDLLLPTRAVDVVIPTQVGPLVEGMCWQIHTAMSNERPPLIAAVSHSVRDYVRSQCWWNYNEPDGSLPTRPESILDGFSPKPLPDNFSPEEFLARGPGFWYKPKRDIPVLYHTGEPLVSVQDLLHSCVEKYGWAAKETAVYAPGAHPWPVDYNNMIQLDRGLAAMPPNPPHGWNDPLVVMESITVHATNESALQSELFGLMGDAPVQLIDPRDTELLVKYQKFMNKAESDGIDQDPKARGWLDRFINRPWAVGLEDCKQHYQTIEVWRLWLQGQKANFEDIPNPVDIWDGPRVHDDRTLDMLDPETYSLFEWEEDDGGYWVDVTTFRPNERHPWVQEILACLPPFRPRVMIRHCASPDCVEPESPSYGETGYSDEERESGGEEMDSADEDEDEAEAE